jgi:spore germination cell wall hydrolase CwlJ-like protein
MRETKSMAARWIGLARPHQPGSLRRRRRKRDKTRHPLDKTLRGFGAACVVGAGVLFNWALFSEASGRTSSVWDQHIGLTQAQAAQLTSADAASPPAPVDEEEVRLLAATAWGEARSEGEDGMRAVAHVMVNRVGARFGDDLKTVILAPKQFSVWNAGDPNRPLVRNPERYARGGTSLETWQTAQEVAREVLSGQSVDPTDGALFYHTRAISPWWSRYGEGRQVIGAHVFYRDVPAQYRAEHARVRVMRTAARAPAQTVGAERGRRAGRVNGVIQYAQIEAAAARAEAAAASTAPPVSADPALTNALAQLPTSSSF